MDNLNLTSANFTNISTSGHPPSVPWASRALAPAVLLSLCFLVGFPGNLVVLILKPNWQKLSRLTQCLMMNLAMSDLLCLVTLPLWIYTQVYSWTLGVVTCKIVAFLVHCSLHSSLLTVTSLSIQRYMQVIHQQRCLQFRKRLLVLLWFIAMILSTPALVVRQTIKDHQNIICLPKYTSPAQHVTVLLTECFVGFSSFTITSCAYIFLNRKLKRAVFFNNASTSKLVTSIIVTFFVLWIPYFVFNLVVVGGIIKNNIGIIQFYGVGYKIFASVTFINSCLNPLLYAFALRICGKNTNTTFDNIEELTTANDAVS